MSVTDENKNFRVIEDLGKDTYTVGYFETLEKAKHFSSILIGFWGSPTYKIEKKQRNRWVSLS